MGMEFDRNGPQYRMFCCHVKAWAIAIGILEGLGLIEQFLQAIFLFCTDTNADGALRFTGTMIGGAIGAILLIAYFVGIAKEHHGYLLPHLILQCIGVVLLGCSTVLLVPIVILAIPQMNKQIIGIIVACFIVILILDALQMWFFIIVLKCYRFFRDQRRAGYVPAVAYHAPSGIHVWTKNANEMEAIVVDDKLRKDVAV